MSYRSPDVLAAEQSTRAIRHTAGDGAFIVAEGGGDDAGFEAALRINDGVHDILVRQGIAASGLANLLPSRHRQEKSLTAWRDVWSGNGQAILSELTRAAREAGFSREAFAPFAEWIHAGPTFVTPESLRALGAGFFLAMYFSRNPERTLVYTVLPNASVLDEATRKELGTAGAHVVSGEAFRADIGRAAGKDIFRFCLATFMITCMTVFILYRNALRCLCVLTPMLTGLALVLLLFTLTGTRLNMFHAVALPLVIALTVDYGIFMQAVLEGSLDAAGRKAVILSALTTLAGFGSLLAARHPALFSLGLVVSASCLAALAAALWVQPLLNSADRPDGKA
jgi:predicted exporter